MDQYWAEERTIVPGNPAKELKSAGLHKASHSSWRVVNYDLVREKFVIEVEVEVADVVDNGFVA